MLPTLFLIGTLLAALLWVWLRSAPAPRGIEGEGLVGTVGAVSVAVPPGGVGLFAYVCAGRRVTRPCRSATRASLPVGAEVWVTDIQGPLLVVERTAP
ncbi:MAG: hypothetical protein H6739_14025 [Alphaproteobacteria bacterium]|nr:hypothetical protein [Alphaproteobacteria bacterium]